MAEPGRGHVQAGVGSEGDTAANTGRMLECHVPEMEVRRPLKDCGE